ncbi:MAG: DUF2138 family protein [Ideonella sp.]|nr:DUF2138 family protein [Ideonella sp.]
MGPNLYYEEHEDRLGLSGALRRVAFEHDPSLSDQLLALALDEPSEVALWTDAKGAPRHWALAMTRGSLAKALQGLATVATKDQQLTVIGEIKTTSWHLEGLPVYALQLSTRRTLAFISLGNRVVVLSDPGLLFSNEREADPQATEVIAGLISGDSGAQGVWRRYFGLSEPGTQHTLVASGAMLSFGYQQFFPSLQALRLDLSPGGGQLNSLVRYQGAAAGTSNGPWSALPSQAAACSMLHVDWTQTRHVMEGAATSVAAPPASGAEATDKDQRSAQAAALGRLADAFDGAAGVCWYERSQMHTPLWVAHAKGAAPSAQVLQDFSNWLLPAAAEVQTADGPALDARIAAPYGAVRGPDGPAYQLRLARVGDWWVFSPDAELVAQAEATLARRYPSLADSLSNPAQTLMVVAPTPLTALIKRETLAVITPQQAGFRQAVETHLLPRLVSLGKLPASQAVLQGKPDAQGWQALSWQPLKAAQP